MVAVAVIFAAVGLIVGERFFGVTPRLSSVRCHWTRQGNFVVQGDISNPSTSATTFAIRPTFWLAGVGQVAADMHDYETVPGRAMKHWSISYSMLDVAPPGTPITKCAPDAYQEDRSAGD
ncbi:MAG: hypothetical protein ABJB93_01645 [Gaiellales bacterium]